MYCNATGTPELTISWTRNESPINTSDNSRISLLDDNKQLTITNVSRTDSGEYRCVAKNRVGRDTSNATTVNVLYKPDITAHPNHRTATEGKNVALSCNADGNPAPTISWTINGSRVNTSGNSRISLSEDKKELFITNVSRTDSGEYRCVANNSVGNDTSNAAELHIQYQSKITAHPQNTTATEGKNVTLSCNADGNPEPTISWTRDGAPVDTSNTSRISFSDDKKQLTITNVNRTDSGDYRCVANNSLGNDTSYVATLDIQFAPEILKNPNDVTAVEGQDAVFSCSVRGNPSPSVSWTKDDEKLNVTANPRLSVSKTNNNHSLIITDVQRSDAGQYRCVAINIINSSTSTAATLQVHFQPYFTWNPEDTTVVEGQNTTLNCEVYGNPVPDVRWTKYGEALDIANQRLNVPFTANTSILTITNVVQADQGLYRCVANNSVNTSTSNPGKLTVHFAPEVTIIGDPEQFVITGKQMLLTCQYNALPPMSEVLWKKNGTVLARNAIVEINDSRVTIPHYNESHVQLSINTTTPQDAGNYSCNVTNDVDSSSDMITIVIQVVPDPPLNVTVDSKSSRVVTISWMAGFNGNSAIQNYTVKISEGNQTFGEAVCQGSLPSSSCVVPSSSTSASLSNLFPWTTYYIRVFARNIVGTSDSSTVVSVTTDEEVPSVAPDFAVTVVNSTAVNVSWQMLTKEEAKGAIQGYYVLYRKPANVWENKTVNGKETTSLLVTSLEKFTFYEFAMQAFNSKGVSNLSTNLEETTAEDKPSAAPKNVRGHNTSSTSILVTWDDVPAADQNGIILTYTITYESLTENHNGNVTVNYPARQTNLTGLRKYNNYSITIFASTVKGDGPASDPIFVITDQDKPTAAPENVTGHNKSSTSIVVTWDDVPAADQNGIILTYTITYESLAENHNGNVTVNYPAQQTTLTGLREYVNYSITVFASTVKGDGPDSSPIIVITDQDKPSAAPKNVTGHNSSSTSILVTWDDVLAADQNGIILTYTITYESQTEGHNGNVTVNYPARQTNLIGLREYVNYSITVFATTVKGDGLASDPIFVITDQDRPTAAPVNVTGHNSSSTSILVTWDDVPAADQNGIILTYTISYESLTKNYSGDVTVNSADHQTNLTGLRKRVNYRITAFASTVKGDGPASDPIFVITDQDKPTAAPENVTGHNKSSTSILVTWDDVPAADQNGIILTYTITYVSLAENHNGNVTVNYPDYQTTLTGLREYVNYSITVLASTVKGDGPASSPIIVITDQDKPDGAPQNVRVQNSSSTSILIMWDEVPADQHNGIITGYTITYHSQTENDNGSVLVGPNDRQKELTNLKEYVNYNISVFASTVKGAGPASDPVIVVRTDQDQPDGAPQNVRGHNSSSTSILVTWDDVPADQQNGIITGYTITYYSQTENDNGSVPTDPNERQKELTNLKEYVNYNISVFASTVKGPGPANDPVIVVRTDQDRPTAAPVNVTGHNSSSTSILVTWDDVPAADQNGIILTYTISYESLTKNHSGDVTVNSADHQTNLTGLRKRVNYRITAFASTVKGDGPASDPIFVITDQDKPTAAPENVTGHNKSSTSILVTWHDVPAADQNGIILTYTITYVSLAGNHNGNVTVNYPDHQTTLTGLREYVNYSITVLASTVKGDGPASSPIIVITDQDKPDGAPQNVRVQNSSSTSILIMWDEVPADQHNGIITGYTITYHSQTENDNGSVLVGPNDRQKELTNLKEYVNYNISVFASTVKGAGPASDPVIVVRTDQDQPDGAPQNVRGHNSSSTSILVTWDDVPADQQNGIITGYTITYYSQTENDNGSVPTDPNERQKELTNLKEYVNYNISVFASTVKGPGPANDPVIVVRTDQDRPTAAPVNVTGHNSSSTSILVTWDDVPAADQNGIILTYTISYESLTKNHSGDVTVNSADHQTNLTGLRKRVNYRITAFASTVKGDGPASDPIFVITDQDKPTAAPENVTGHNKSSTSILVTWHDVPAADQNGIILTYTITYVSLVENHNGNVTVNYPDHQTTLTGLREYVNYSITVLASTVKGDGPASSPIIVITDQDKPDGAPQNVRVQNSSSTSILIMWDEVPADQHNGIITGYTITYHSQTENDNGSVLVGPNDRQKELTNLKEYVNYNISVFASTVKGAGPASDPVIVVRTDQDQPDGAPQNVRGHNSSSTSILVTWDDVLADQQNGIITGYTITYYSQTENDNGNVPTDPNERQKELTNLKEYVNYNISVFASTVKGPGPANDPVIVVRTDQDRPTAAPVNVTGHNSSSTSILVTWDDVPAADQNGIILTYTISYESLTKNHSGDVTVNSADHQTNLTGLRKRVNYRITVFASTVKGDGPASDPIFVITDQDKPTAAPENVTGHNKSSTSILVTWDDVPAADQNGIILTYTITYESLAENHNGNVTVNYPDHQTTLTGLREYVNYSITVLASTVKGDGPASSPIIVITDQDKPDGAPQNVRVQNSSSTSILIMWDEVPADQHNGIITGYTINYHSQTENDNGSVLVGPNDRQKELTNLKEYVNYNISVFAFTVKGAGPASDPVIVVRTDQDQPDGAPQNVRGHNSSSTSILVTWDEVPADQQNGIITGYTITYYSQTENDNGSVPAGPNDRQKELTNLKEYVNYNISVFASTVKGPGPANDPVIVVRTDQDKPTVAPVYVTGHNSSSTSILVTWDDVPAADRNGIILSYTITYESLTENHNGNVTVDYPARQTNLTGLRQYVNYSITVFASTVKGDGPVGNPIVVITDQDRPSAPPQDLALKDTTSISILVEWNEVQDADKNGIITSYTVSYQAVTSALVENTTVNATTREANLTGLIKNMNYSIRVLASTIKGNGKYSDPEFFITNQDVPGAAPQPVTGHHTSSTSILVTWGEVPADKQHGNIVNYTVFYKESAGGGAELKKHVDSPKREIELTQLKKYTKYSIQVLAATVKGDGPRSVSIPVRTDQDSK
ncbi:protein sidekick-1-like isoform X3 [Oculina patagonica]